MVARRFLGILGYIGFVGFVISLTIFVITYTTPSVNAILQFLHLPEGNWLGYLIKALFAVILLTFLYFAIIRTAWKKAEKSVDENPIDTSDIRKLIESVNNLVDEIRKRRNEQV